MTYPTQISTECPWECLEERQTDELVKKLFSLEEPWRSRFLVFLAERIDAGIGDAREVHPEWVRGWLRDRRLKKMMKQLLDRWMP